MSRRLECEIIEDDDRFFQLEASWRGLYEESSNASASLHWEWQSQWWRVFKQQQLLQVALFWHGGTLAAILPLYREILPDGLRCLRFLSCSSSRTEGLYPEYLDVLCREEWRNEVSAKLKPLLFSQEFAPWDVLMLERFSENSLIAGVLRKLASFSSLLRKSSIVCPQSDLSRGFAAYLERQSPNSRAHSRRLLSAFERDKVSYRIAENDEELGSFFDELVLLHQSRWKEQGEQGAFVSERVRSFHRAILRGLVPGGEVVLARLSDQEGSLAIVYGFIINKKFEFYQSGMRNSSNGRIKSPGILAHLLTMQHLSERGIRVYDFLGGESNYKTRLATDSQKLMSISLYRPSFSTALVLGRRALAKVLK